MIVNFVAWVVGEILDLLSLVGLAFTVSDLQILLAEKNKNTY